MFDSPSFPPPQASPTSPAVCEEADQKEMRKFLQMKASQEVKMRAEKEKMQKIDKMLEMKKREKQMEELKVENSRMRISSHLSSAKDIVARKEMDLAEQALEIKKQTSLLLKLQQNMLTEKRKTEEEKRHLKDQETDHGTAAVSSKSAKG